MVEEMVAALDEQDLEIILEDVKEDGVSGVIYNVRGGGVRGHLQCKERRGVSGVIYNVRGRGAYKYHSSLILVSILDK